MVLTASLGTDEPTDGSFSTGKVDVCVNFLIKHRSQGFIAIALCVRVSCVRVSVNNIAQKIFNQSTSYFVAGFPMNQG